MGIRPGEFTSLEPLVGTNRLINPNQLLNKGLLYTVQSDYSPDRLRRALDYHNGISRTEQGLPKLWVSQVQNGKKAGDTEYTIYDGNHRLGIACIRGLQVEVNFKGLWTNELANKYPRMPFSVFLKKLKSDQVPDLTELW